MALPLWLATALPGIFSSIAGGLFGGNQQAPTNPSSPGDDQGARNAEAEAARLRAQAEADAAKAAADSKKMWNTIAAVAGVVTGVALLIWLAKSVLSAPKTARRWYNRRRTRK